jgi:hypothetical protein
MTEEKSFKQKIEELPVEKEKLSLGEFAKKKYEIDKNWDPLEPKGYYLKSFRKLQDGIDGVQNAFYIIAADTNIGKTAILVNLCMDLIESNEKVKCLYFTLDDTRERILNRIYSRQTGINLWEIYKRQNDPKKATKQHDAVKKIIEYCDSEKIDILEVLDSDEILKIVEAEYQRNKNLVVLIDGLHEMNPCLTTAEVRKDPNRRKSKKTDDGNILTTADIAGSRSMGYRADLCILLTPENMGDFENPDCKAPFLNVYFSKNKLGFIKGHYQFKFEKHTAKIEEHKAGDSKAKKGRGEGNFFPG